MYRITVKGSAERDLRRIDRSMISRVAKAIQALGENPRPSSCRKLSGSDSEFRVRIGDYRIIYVIDDMSRTIDVQRIRHRKDAYH